MKIQLKIGRYSFLSILIERIVLFSDFSVSLSVRRQRNNGFILEKIKVTKEYYINQDVIHI